MTPADVREPFANDRLISISLPPQTWLGYLSALLVWLAELPDDAVDRGVLLGIHAFQYAVEQSPAGYDQNVAETRDWLRKIMEQKGQPPLTPREEACVRRVVRRMWQAPPKPAKKG